jgi:ADP-ribose pyrophosphatase YjhB (NUDIX family)
MKWVRKALGCAIVLVDREGRVLVLRRAYPPHDWVLPGGNAEAGESPVETVRRELREETGLEIVPERLTGIYYQRDHRAGEFLHFVFRAAVPDGAEVRPDPDEVAEWGYFEVADLPQPMNVSTARRLADALLPEPQPLPAELPAGSEP